MKRRRFHLCTLRNLEIRLLKLSIGFGLFFGSILFVTSLLTGRHPDGEKFFSPEVGNRRAILSILDPTHQISKLDETMVKTIVKTKLKLSTEELVIDAVITYVNGSDPLLRDQIEMFVCKHENLRSSGRGRFTDNDDLKYLLRSIDKFAKFFRYIFLVVAFESQVPSWLNTEHPKLRIKYHRDIWFNTAYLPNFNSVAIEGSIHRIPELSEHYVEFNDDLLLLDTIEPSDFFIGTPDNVTVIYRYDFSHKMPTKLYDITNPQAHWVNPHINAVKLARDACPNNVTEFKAYDRFPCHTPCAMVKSVLAAAEKEENLLPVLQQTWKAKFRDSKTTGMKQFSQWYGRVDRLHQTLKTVLRYGYCTEMVDVIVTSCHEMHRLDFRRDAENAAEVEKTLKTLGSAPDQIISKSRKFMVFSDQAYKDVDTADGKKVVNYMNGFRKLLFRQKSAFEL